MKFSSILFCLLAFSLSGCVVSTPDFDTCVSRSDESFIVPLSKELTRRNIEFKLKGNQICYKSKDQIEFKKADHFVTSYRNGVATLVSNLEAEKRIINWLIINKKEYKVSNSADGKRFIIILSDSEENAEQNRKELKKLERGE